MAHPRHRGRRHRFARHRGDCRDNRRPDDGEHRTARRWRGSGILQAAALSFFAFAGYARIATLGEEVRDPAHTIPRAIPVALGITLVVYSTVAFAALIAVGPDTLASAAAPLTAVVDAGSLPAASTIGGTVLLATGAAVWLTRQRRTPPATAAEARTQR